MKYKFEQFNVEIIDPTVEITHVNDSIILQTCSVDVKLTTDSSEFGVNLDGFSYVNTWEDSDIQAWVEIELQKYAV